MSAFAETTCILPSLSSSSYSTCSAMRSGVGSGNVLGVTGGATGVSEAEVGAEAESDGVALGRGALLAAGLLILLAGLMEKRRMGAHEKVYGDSVTMRQAGWIGAIQGLCLPFRGFSRSGATISTGMLTGASKERAERFSFALALVLTPPAVGREVLRLVKASHEAAAAGTPIDLHGSMMMGLLGAVFAFLAGLVALKWLSSWLEEGRWYLFGIYCVVAACVVFGLHHSGY